MCISTRDNRCLWSAFFFFLILLLHPMKSILVDFSVLPKSWQILNQFMVGISIGGGNYLNRREYHMTRSRAYHALQFPWCLGWEHSQQLPAQWWCWFPLQGMWKRCCCPRWWGAARKRTARSLQPSMRYQVSFPSCKSQNVMHIQRMTALRGVLQLKKKIN